MPASMPSGESPQHAAFYDYLQAHQQTMYKPDTWHVAGSTLRGCGASSIVLCAVLIWWVWQYRSTRQAGRHLRGGHVGRIHDGAGAGRRRFFFLLTVVVVGWAVALIVGHLVWGQKF